MNRSDILVIDAQRDITGSLADHLTKGGYTVRCVADGEGALELANSHLPDLVILEMMLPGMIGLDVCKALKANDKTRDVPILILSARGDEADIVTGLELGADDYVTKPFSPRVLMARVRAILRRKSAVAVLDDQLIQIHDLTIDPKRHVIVRNSKSIEATFTEFRILQLLASHPGWVFTRGEIVEAARGQDTHVTERSVDVHIVALRRKLGAAKRHIEAVRGVGYRLAEQGSGTKTAG